MIIDALKAGNFRVTSAHLGDVCYDTMLAWVKRGMDADALDRAGESVKQSERIYLNFLRDVKKAEAHAQAVHVQRIVTASQSPKHWTASAWFLERKFPQEWGRKDRVEHDTPGGQPLQVEHEHNLNLSNLSLADLKTLHEIALRAQGKTVQMIESVVEDAPPGVS